LRAYNHEKKSESYLSARTIAPASSCRSPVSLSVVTAAVKPTPLLPLPVVAIARGAVFRTYLRKNKVYELF